MGSDTYQTTIGEIATVYDGPHATPKKLDKGDAYFLSISSLENGKLDLSKSVFVSEEDFQKWTKRVTPKAGDVLFSYETRLGEAALMPDQLKACLGRRMGLLRPNLDKVYPKFLLYAYLSPTFQSEIKLRTVTGCTVDRIALTELAQFPIRIPPLPEQKAIAHILGSLDDKIELNRQMNAILEAMAQALFKSWFVDFDPVLDNALAAGNPIPDELQSKAAARLALGDARKPLPTDIQALFPSSFVLTEEMGWIPEGWEVGVISDWGKVITGKTPSKNIESAYGNEGKMFVTPTDIENHLFVLNTQRYLSHAGQAAVKNNKLPQYSICTTCIGSQMGKTIITVEESFTNQQINSLIPTSLDFLYYLALTLRSKREDLHLLGSSGSTMPIVNKSTFEQFSILNPKSYLLKAFNNLVTDFFEKMVVAEKEIFTLTALRDTLLPKLLSGELRIPE